MDIGILIRNEYYMMANNCFDIYNIKTPLANRVIV